MSEILFATHGGPSADGAGRVAALLAARRGATMSAVCVLEPLRIVDGGFAAMYVPTLEEDEAVRASLRMAVAEQLRRCDASATLHVRTGSAASEIADEARESEAEVIVLGLGMHRLLDRALGNETALQLAQLATTPVLAVPATMTALPRRVVAAIDFSPTSVASAKACARWLTDGDVLHLVYVAGVWHGGFPLTQRISAENVLNAISQQINAPEGVRIEQSVVEGEPAIRLLEITATTNAELTVLGSHGYGFWKRLAIGSVASKILRLSSAAVLVTPIGSLASSFSSIAEVVSTTSTN